jgi:hypothetical protein
MKNSFFSILAAASLLATTSFAAPASFTNDRDGRAGTQQNPNERFNDRNDKDFNYGFDKKHKVTPEERKRWEDAHKNDRKDQKDDRKDFKKDQKDDRKDLKKDLKDDRKDFKKDQKDDRKEFKKDQKDDRKDNNYGFDKNHKVTPEERARWEAAHKNDNHR